MSRVASQIFLNSIEKAISTLGMGALDPSPNLTPLPSSAINRRPHGRVQLPGYRLAC